MSNSLQRWSREAVSSQFPFRFHFTSITVFLWACLGERGRDTALSHAPAPRGPSTAHSSWAHSRQDAGLLGTLPVRERLNSQRSQTLPRLGVPELDGLLAVLAARDHQTFGGMPVHTLDISTVTCTHTHARTHTSFDPGVYAFSQSDRGEFLVEFEGLGQNQSAP